MATTAAAPKPAAKKPAATQGSSDGSFEQVHARDVVGRFTTGPDANRGPQQGVDTRAAENLLRSNGYWRSGMTYQEALARAKANLSTSSDGDTLSALRAEAASIVIPKKAKKAKGSRKKAKKAPKRKPTDIRRGDRVRSTPEHPWRRPNGPAPVPTPTNVPPTAPVAGGPLTGNAGAGNRVWPPQWGDEPPKSAPGGLARTQGFEDGSAVYEGGIVYDPAKGVFREVGQSPSASGLPSLAPSKGPKGAALLARYSDGSAVYDNGTVWDPGLNAYRQPGAPEPAPEVAAPQPPNTPPESMPTKAEHGSLEVKGEEPVMEYKALPITGLAVLDAAEGIVECIVSVTGIKDRVDDIIMPGAYTKTLQVRTPKGVYSHDWDKPIARTLSIRELPPGHKDLPVTFRGEPWPEAAGALMVKAQFNLKTERGRDAYEDVVFYGDEQEWSIGYNVPVGGSKTTNGVRYIKTMDLFEFSPVLFGAMPLAGTLSVKSAQQAWAAVKDVVGGQHGPTFDTPAGFGNAADKPTGNLPFTVCAQHGDQPGEVRAKCMAMKACALRTGNDEVTAAEVKSLMVEMADLRRSL